MPENPLDDARDEIDRTRRELERMFGLGEKFNDDVDRINRAIGEGFHVFERIFPFRDLQNRIEALHYDIPAHASDLATLILRQGLEPKPRVEIPGTDHNGRRF
jgi:hypothetical protein